MTQGAIDLVGGILSGSGTLGATDGVVVHENAAINPGNSPGTLNILGDLDLEGTLTIEFGLDAYDILNVSGQTTFFEDSRVVFDFLDSFMPTAGQTFDFLYSAGGVVGFDVAQFSFADTFSGLDWDLTYSNQGLHLAFSSLDDDPENVPEPEAWGLIGLGLVSMGLAMRRRRYAPSLRLAGSH